MKVGVTLEPLAARKIPPLARKPGQRNQLLPLVRFG